MNKELILFLVGIIVLGIIFGLYLHYDNISGIEEDLALSVYFIENVTKIESAKIQLDFTKEKLIFQSKFFVEGTGIKLDAGSRGFQFDGYCSDDLALYTSGEQIQSLTWHDKKPVSFQEYENVEYVIMTKSCAFDEPIIPNGEFRVHLFGNNQTVGAPIDDLQFEMLFDSKQYACEGTCVYAKEFVYTDFVDSEKNIRTAILDSVEPNMRSISFDLRTTDTNYENLSDIFFSIFQVGIGVLMTIMVYLFSSKHQQRIGRLLNRHSEQQSEITRMISKMDARDTKESEERGMKKTYYEKQYVHALTGAKEQIQKINEIMAKEKKVNNKVKFAWEKLKIPAERLDFLAIVSNDIVDHQIVDDINLIQGSMRENIQNTVESIETQLGWITIVLDRVLKRELKTRREEALKEQLEILEKSIEKQFKELGIKGNTLVEYKKSRSDKLKNRYLYDDEVN